MKKETMKCPEFKIACKKAWNFTRNFIRKVIEFDIGVIKETY